MLTQSQRAEMTAWLRRGGEADAGRITRRDPGITQLPASFAQEQVWFIDKFAPGQAAYNIPCTIAITGPLDIAALTRALAGLTARHESLRTRLVTGQDGQPVQVIDEPVTPDLAVTDLTRAGLRDHIFAAAMRPFDLAAGPLMRASLARLSPAEHLLVTVLHHTIFDGLSAGVLLRDLAALYTAEVTGQPCALAELPVQFADYALWERNRLRDGTLASLQDYWQQTMTGFETLQFPADHPRPVVDEFAGSVLEQVISPAVLAGLREISSRQETTMFTTFTASMLTLLHRYTGQTDLVAGTVSANRNRNVLAPVIGFLVNTLPIRTDLTGDPPFTELLARVKESALGAFAHQDLPFSMIVDTLKVTRDASRTPVFQIMLTCTEREDVPLPAADVEFSLGDVAGIDAAKFDLTFAAQARRDGLRIECTYKTSLYDPATIERLLAHLETLLHGIVASPAARLSELPILTQAELHAELIDWNSTTAPAPGGCAHQRFEAQVLATPDAIAARYENQSLTYTELNQQADQIAARLRDHGVGPESLVGVCMHTSLRRLAAFIGIWKAGGGYVPLDPDLPRERLEFKVADTGMKIIVADNDAASPALPAETIVVNDHLEAAANAAGTGVTPANTAYVIYTSGSTGQPKGVIIEHRSLVNLAHAMSTRWQIGPGSRVLQFASFTFDVSVMDMFLPLLSGGTLVLAAPGTLHSPPRLAALLREAHITFTCLPPAVLNLLPEGDYPDLRTLMAAGEELPAELARRWIRPGLQLINGYGPTEATVIATLAEIDARTPMPPPIGFPVHCNYHAYVLDQYLNPVPVGVTGELHLGGAGLARGYLNRPGLTAERFVRAPSGERLYKTGDLVKRRPDGSIVYLGRIDNQVKIHGIRIEPGEIEAALLTHPAITQAVVTVTTSPSADPELAAYLLTQTTVTGTQAREHLARMLPAAMIPAHFITLDAFPLNPSGKVDRSALPAPEPAVAADHVPPETLVEMLLADIYAGLLGVAQVGATDSFFDLGGSSLLAMGLVGALDAELDVDVGPAAVFLAPTPRRLAALLRTEHGLDDQDLDG